MRIGELRQGIDRMAVGLGKQSQNSSTDDKCRRMLLQGLERLRWPTDELGNVGQRTLKLCEQGAVGILNLDHSTNVCRGKGIQLDFSELCAKATDVCNVLA